MINATFPCMLNLTNGGMVQITGPVRKGMYSRFPKTRKAALKPTASGRGMEDVLLTRRTISHYTFACD